MANENQKFFREKVKFWEFSTESENLSKIGENLKQGGKCIMASERMDAPVHRSLARSLNWKFSIKSLFCNYLSLPVTPPWRFDRKEGGAAQFGGSSMNNLPFVTISENVETPSSPSKPAQQRNRDNTMTQPLRHLAKSQRLSLLGCCWCRPTIY